MSGAPARSLPQHRLGVAYRPELAASLWAHADEIDVIEIIADDWFGAGRSQLSALRALARRVALRVHAVGLGLASCAPVDLARVNALARVVDAAGGEWSEHLAFVRAGGIELGQLCAPPRTAATLEGLAHNVERARRIIGSLPALENVASVIDPPGSELGEAEFVASALQLTGAPLLLDLHNLHANATNFGFDALACLDRIPVERVRSVHLAGGQRVRHGDSCRVLDDHRHAVPAAVYTLLEQLAPRLTRPIDIILERDGRPPPWPIYAAELSRAREALSRARAHPAHASGSPASTLGQSAARGSCSPAAGACDALAVQRAQAAAPSSGLEAWLARLYTDSALRERFLANPQSVLDAAADRAAQRGVPVLNEAERRALAQLDQPGLVLHARSLAAKQRRRPDRARPRLGDRLRAGWQRLRAATAVAAGKSASGSTRAADPC